MSLRSDALSLIDANPSITIPEIVKAINDPAQFNDPHERMMSPDMVVAYLTKHDCVATLKATQDSKAMGFLLALESGGVTEFNVMNSHPLGVAQQGLLAHMVSAGAVNAGFQAACIDYCNTTKARYTNVTEMQVKAALYPATWKDVTIESGNDKVVLPEGDVFLNQSNKGGFRFIVTAADSFTGSVRVKMYAGKASDGVIAEQAGVNIVFTADFVVGEAMVPQSVIRTAPLQGYKWFKFKYLEPYEGALTSVSVEGLA